MSDWDRFQADVGFMDTMAFSSWSTLMLTSGGHDAEALAMVTLQMYHYVKETVPVLRFALDRVPDGPDHDDYRGFLEAFIREEEGHDAVALSDLKNLGYDRDACKATAPLPTTLNLQGANRAGVIRYGAYYLLGETYATEVTGARMSARVYDVYRDILGKRCVKFYDVHGEADVEHAAFSETLIRAKLGDPARYEAIVVGCINAWRNLLLLGTEIQSYKLYPAMYQLPRRTP